jgi:hypothetical protein
MTQKKRTKPKTAATIASVRASHAANGPAVPRASAARAQGVGAYRRLVDEPKETARAEKKRRPSGSFRDRATALCRYPVVKNLRQASTFVREATQAVVDTARGAALQFWKKYATT